MPPLQGFSDNAFQTHDDFKTACISLLRALRPYQSPGGARIKLPLETGTHFDDVAAQLEGFARPLWAVGTLMHSKILSPDEVKELVDPYVRGLANGTDPSHPEYWGPVVLRDQRMVEMEIISFALLAAPETMFNAQSAEAKHNITEWLKTINDKDFPTTNWLWFRVMTNLALIQVCGVPKEDVLDAMKADLDLMEQFYLGDGWAADGIWSENGRQADYYSGSFAIQFSQLIYAKFAQDLDPERCERFRNRAIEFANTFWRYFDTNGAAIPFGRSLTYRFAFAGFWSALAFSSIPLSSLPSPLSTPGTIKGLLLRHFSWWRSHPSIFNIDGTLTIGFAYPNMYMSEDYNSPQSVYWALKSFLALGLPASHAFWTQDAQPLPVVPEREKVTVVKQPRHMIVQGQNHHYFFNMGQFCPWPLKATEAKYGKYAYSSHFGFSVPTGPLIQQLAPDSTLALSKDGGETWRVPWKLSGSGLKIGTASLYRGAQVVGTMPTLESVWRPWVDADIAVHTTLVAPSERWPDWYVTQHRITQSGPPSPHAKIVAVQGGFAIQGRGHARGQVLEAFEHVETLVHGKGIGFSEGTITTPSSTLILSSAGASGIRNLSASSTLHQHPQTPITHIHISPDILKPDANTNLIWQRTLIPTLKLETASAFREVRFATAVFALARTADRVSGYEGLDVEGLWGDGPVLGGEGDGDGEGYYFRVE
ncbi:hypothetical protein T440DRAFT_497081 [Plenodomus tracheiphilus IPT5]|uniref:Uncharacterized protein n=1 Tax=Plenodomus tracheiphilus IPT5 TaxID=1408161 RepID=A0A6A7BCT9_9PLEO|nr:hypothetical protein T440DRAFT_497081 [Plenodomus tracheiphilus IPT5]